jgi:hypothetical protein
MNDRDDLTDADYERLADFAEAGFEPSALKTRRGRPSLGGSPGPSPRVATRLPADVHAKALARADAEGRTLGEVMRSLVEAYANGAPTEKPAGR